MFIVGILSWWYGAGWRQTISGVMARIDGAVDYFSIPQLMLTLFAPFRQISAGSVRGSLGVKWRAFVDRTISRMIGSIVRIIIIFVGVLAILLHIVSGVVVALFWPFLPFLPVVGFLLFISGWAPSIWS